MKIAFISQVYDKVIPPNQNSIGVWTYEVARRLSQSSQVVVYLKVRGDAEKVESGEKFAYRFIKVKLNRILRKLDSLFSRFLLVGDSITSFDLEGLVYILKVASDLRKQRCDIVHIHNYSQFVPIIRALNPRIRVVLHMHCEWLTQFDARIIESRLSKVDLIIGVSEHITEKIRRRFPQFANQCRTVHNGVDICKFVVAGDHQTQDNGVIQMLFVGRVSPEKGIHDLIEALNIVVDHHSEIILHIAGSIEALSKKFIDSLSDEVEVAQLASFSQVEGGYERHLQQQISPKLSGKVIFHGYVPHSKIAGFYRAADLVLNPSYSESFGLSLVEAMASEVPVVATQVGGMPEIVINGETGLLVQRGDSQALAQAILRLIENHDLRNSMGKAGRQRVQEFFTWERVAETLFTHYSSCVR